jgi:hypothetical protein
VGGGNFIYAMNNNQMGHHGINRPRPLGFFFALLVFLCGNVVSGQDETVLFSTSGPGVSTTISNWGVNCLSTTDIHRDLIYMGSNTVNFVLVGFQADTPQTNNSINAVDMAAFSYTTNAAAMVPTTNWVMSYASGAGVNSWYQSGTGTVYPDLWARNMEVWQRAFNHSMAWTMPFNEPDYGWGGDRNKTSMTLWAT